ncbi:hypothetical protein [Paenarthrobacter ureafaciens]|uniref:hypothetical protein n=1 Tax=Paenarthrobacter ureafaciens TaxID=37931 RepID=UPI00039857F0|nr:hypothetical protein [Paenarthrobacter ureafaciens]AOY74152.1 hypothetical protein ARZXY2_4653 [Arthrobacter sp. ZXY-2]
MGLRDVRVDDHIDWAAALVRFGERKRAVRATRALGVLAGHLHTSTPECAAQKDAASVTAETKGAERMATY